MEVRCHRGGGPRHQCLTRALRRGSQGARARLIGVSALLTTTMVGIREVVPAVHAAGLPTRVLAARAPVTAEFAAEIGAEGYAPDAGSSVEVALRTVTA
jgi:5-methyltetrahydrofolate--homocysteine methyltransferase